MFGIRVLIADSDTQFRKALKDVLRYLDYHLVGEASEARAALQLIFQSEPSLVIFEPGLPGTESMDLAGIVDEHKVAPLVVSVDGARNETEDYISMPGVFGVLIKPLAPWSVQPTLEAALINFKRTMNLEREIARLKNELETRKLVEKAKGLLMEKKSFSERDAYKYLQKLSMDKCISMSKAARRIILLFQKSL